MNTPPTTPPYGLGRSARLGGVVALFCFYLLIGSRERPWADATPIYEVAESLVRDLDVSIKTPWPIELPAGKDGRIYAVAPLLQSLVHVPGAALRVGLSHLGPRTADWFWPFAVHLGPAFLGALLCLVFLSLCAQLRVARRTAFLSTAALALASTILVYARSPYSEILQAALFSWFFLLLLRLAETPTRRVAFWFGLAAGLLVNAKAVYLVVLPGAIAYLAWYWQKARAASAGAPDRALALRLCAAALLGFFPTLLIILLYNKARWGGFLQTGYDLDVPVFTERIVVGLWGMFLSPGKSVFLYSPPLLLSVLALPRTWRRKPLLLAAMALTILPVLLVYSRFLFWSGDYAWGPRYLVFAVPVLFLPGVMLLDDLFAAAPGWWRRLKFAGVAAVLGFGLLVQFLGSALYWDHFIRIALEARANWLGWPNKTGAPVEPVYGVCGACFEDVHPIQWLPPFLPIDGHWWLFRHVFAGHDATRALEDAPWRRYTTVATAIDNTYPRARLDWWYLNFRGLEAHDGTAGATASAGSGPSGVGLGILLGLTFGVCAGGFLCWRGCSDRGEYATAPLSKRDQGTTGELR